MAKTCQRTAQLGGRGTLVQAAPRRGPGRQVVLGLHWLWRDWYAPQLRPSCLMRSSGLQSSPQLDGKVCCERGHQLVRSHGVARAVRQLVERPDQRLSFLSNAMRAHEWTGSH
ncbi:hypothetical protein WJX72_011213 [[Myrmecia] bisecta]|uniref:Uncharacterized protein n=1 Tax=[Myrmecia] bisecta TaxID=41462 RepID=A0AAW1RAN4_9CHLO